ncbi:hypothetical protein SKAU_G00059950 [Synaphobranchus kaupii]|uniref:Uncharacterized protein n=1 Tax=Synaphobranchus kaupii TaxID=118154 RepID=A0A9Q1G4U0_SYNKA|nr:hypothetical protein SKAU_G00059950 [Synaphobranchus kaupii]
MLPISPLLVIGINYIWKTPSLLYKDKKALVPKPRRGASLMPCPTPLLSALAMEAMGPSLSVCELPSYTKRRPVIIKANVTSGENAILIIDQRQEVLEGKEKEVQPPQALPG